MKTFDADIIENIDWFAGTMLADFYVPKDEAGRERMDRVMRDSIDLNHIYASHEVARDASAPGIVEAYEVVRTDIARRISVDLAASHAAGEFPDLHKHPQFDPSVPLDPEAFATPMDQRYRQTLLPALPSPYDEAFSKPPISAETAFELGAIGGKLVADAPISAPKEVANSIDATERAKRGLDRLAQQRGLSTNPEARPSYDVVAVDLGTRLSVILEKGLREGHLDASLLTDRERSIVADPHRPQPTDARGVKDQARGIPAGRPPVASKGPEQDAPVLDARDRGASR